MPRLKSKLGTWHWLCSTNSIQMSGSVRLLQLARVHSKHGQTSFYWTDVVGWEEESCMERCRSSQGSWNPSDGFGPTNNKPTRFGSSSFFLLSVRNVDKDCWKPHSRQNDVFWSRIDELDIESDFADWTWEQCLIFVTQQTTCGRLSADGHVMGRQDHRWVKTALELEGRRARS